MEREFGLDSQTLTIAIKGEVNVFRVRRLVNNIIDAIGMTPIFDAKIYEYPDDIGFIYIQPIWESAIMFDGWPRHQGGFMWICSCKAIDQNKVLDVVRNSDYAAVKCDFMEMAL